MPYRHNELESLDQLTHEEAVALAALVRALVHADGRVCELEREELRALSDELGDRSLAKLMDEASRHGTSPEAMRELCLKVVRVDARELIFGALFNLATAGSIQPAEAKLLGWLETFWNLDQHFAGNGENEEPK